ncbi:hypothetical protein UPYG_G00060210, partial [Umbra pygmaea]
MSAKDRLCWVSLSAPSDPAMSQVEKKAGLLRRTSSSKKPLKEKVVLMYDEIFAKEDPAKNNPRFWDELFLMKV